MADFCKLAKNSDQEYECRGCQIIGTMFEKYELMSKKATKPLIAKFKFHNDFFELEHCAKKGWATCRVFQRALWLRQITKRDADRLGNLLQEDGSGAEDGVWAKLGPTQATGTMHHSGQIHVEVGIGNPPQDRRSAMVLCTSRQSDRPTNLSFMSTTDAMSKEAKKLLQDCHDSKGSDTRCKNLGWSSRNPSNLVEIVSGTGNLKLIETSNSALVPYAALSYCWVSHLANSEPEKALTTSQKTTEGNLTERRSLFSASQLPRTIRDVCKLTWDLGIKYIWIDAICILPGADWNDEVSKMHEVYGNAQVTLAVCSSEMSTDGLLSKRQAWQYERDRCRLPSGQWLSNLDMGLNEIRLQSPLSTRAWTLQEERLSPRILYISGQRLYWSCSHCQYTEMGHHSPQRLLEGPDTFNWMRPPQTFLATHRDQDESSLYEQWLELVKDHAKRDMFLNKDRFPAISGLAVRYIDLYEDMGVVKREEYLAGLWRQRFAQGLAWSMEATKRPSYNLWDLAPSWSWASVPKCSDIITQPAFEPIPEFELLEKPNLGKQGQSDEALEVVKRGASVISIKVRGRFRRFIQERSVIESQEWSKRCFRFLKLYYRMGA